MIEDDELRSLYKTSSEEHLQKLEAGILHLEKNPEDLSILTDLLREAHSLKGDSRMLEVQGVEKLSHEIEHVLGQVQRQERVITPEWSDRLYGAIDAMGCFVNEAVTGEPAGVQLFQAMARLMGADQPPSSPPVVPALVMEKPAIPEVREEPIAPEPIETQTPGGGSAPPPQVVVIRHGANQPPVPLPPPVTPAPPEPVATASTPATGLAGEPYRINTIRVETRHLDALMTQTGELTVTKTRIAHTATAIDNLASLWEEGKNQWRSVGFHLEGSYLDRFEQLLTQLRVSSQENHTRLEIIADELEDKVRTLRLLPLSTVFQLFPRMVRDLARDQGKDVDLVMEGGETAADKHILEEIKDPLMHMVRNAIDHGIETMDDRQRLGKPPRATIWLRGYQTANNIIIEVKDDGRGLDLVRIKQTAIERGLYRPEELETMTPNQIQNLIFAPGFSTRKLVTEVSGRGVGLDVVHTNVERLKGAIHIESTPGKGCTFRLQLGTTLATANVLLVLVQGIVHAIPIEFVQTTLLLDLDAIFTIEGRQTIAFDNQAVSVAFLAELLELSQTQKDRREDQEQNRRNQSCIILQIGEERLGLFVDRLLDTQDVVIKPQSKLLKRVRNVTGATILGTGEVCMILNPQDLLRSVQKHNGSNINRNPKAPIATETPQQKRPVILLAEDSIATRTQEKRILEAAGYQVVTAVDGLDGFNKLQTGQFDALISDIQMPNLDGLELTAKVRQMPDYKELPIILVTSMTSDEDKRRGVEAGANAYITKDKFNQSVLLETLKRLV